MTALRRFLSLLCLCYFCLHATPFAQAPPDVIDKIVGTIFSYTAPNCTMPMYKYNYGGAIIFDAMYRATQLFSIENSNNNNNYNTSKILDYNSLLSPTLNDYLYNSTLSTPAYKIINNETMPWNDYYEREIGDWTGLFPIVYLDQLLYQYIKSGNDSSIFNFTGKYANEWQVIFQSADYYVLQYPRYLPDQYHTVSRDNGGAWKNQPNINSSFLWADDNYMGATLVKRLAQVLHFCNNNVMNNCYNQNVWQNISKYIDFAYKQDVGFASYLIYNNDSNSITTHKQDIISGEDEHYINIDINLYAHGYNYATNDHSCCPWSGANAWIMGSHMETIRMFENINSNSSNNSVNNYKYYNYNYTKQEQNIIRLYQNHVNTVASLMDNNTGRWHQVINDTSTFLETAASGAFLDGIIQGRIRNILPTNIYCLDDWDRIIDLAWNGLLRMIDVNTGIIYKQTNGTGIENNVEQYQERTTDYCSSGDPGDPAFVLNAIVSYQQYLNLIHQITN